MSNQDQDIWQLAAEREAAIAEAARNAAQDNEVMEWSDDSDDGNNKSSQSKAATVRVRDP